MKIRVLIMAVLLCLLALTSWLLRKQMGEMRAWINGPSVEYPVKVNGGTLHAHTGAISDETVVWLICLTRSISVWEVYRQMSRMPYSAHLALAISKSKFA